MGISHFHVKHKKPSRRAPEAEAKVEVIEKRAACPQLYKAPDFGQTYDSLQPLTITWDPSCISDKQVDIYLISPSSDAPRIHIWEQVWNDAGTYTADLMPRWWNSTSKQALQISIIGHNTPIFLSQYPAGPVFFATYAEPSTGTPPSADTNLLSSGVTTVNSTAPKMNSGKTAAAVILPLLFVFICIGVYIKMKRSKGIKDRKRWTEAVDKRMSTISTDWKSVSVAGANAAIRNSMAVGNRSSSFSFGAIRPSSQFAVEGDDTAGRSQREVSQMRTGVGLRNPAALTSTDRVSRVSFAPDTRVSRVSFADSRPSGESRRTRAFHSAYIPPVPALPDHAADTSTSTEGASDDGMAQFSPRQTQGPMALTPEYISTNVSAARQDMSKEGCNNGNGSDLADFMPALSMMRTGGNQAESDDYLLPSPTPPSPTHPKPISSSTPATMTSPVMSTLPMQPMPATVMSPDDMLRAYAERKKSMALKGTSISYPMPVANATTAVPSAPSTPTNSNNMRVLYDAATGSTAPGPAPQAEVDYDGARTEYTMSQYSAAESYQQEAGGQYAFGAHHYNAAIGGGVGAGVGAYQHQQGNGAYQHQHQHNGSVGVGAYGGARYEIGADEEDDLGREAYGGHAA